MYILPRRSGRSEVNVQPLWTTGTRCLVEVKRNLEGLKHFQHPELGRFDLEFSSFQVAEQPSLRLFLYTPADGRSEEKLREAVAAASTLNLCDVPPRELVQVK